MQNDNHALKAKLELKIKSLGIWYKFIKKPRSMVHTAEAANSMGFPIAQFAKNLMAQTDDNKHIALIIPGDRRLDHKIVAQILGVKNISLVPFEQAHTVSGYPPGGTPSLGYEQTLTVLVDEALLLYETVYCGGGSPDYLLEIKIEDVLRINSAKVFNITK